MTTAFGQPVACCPSPGSVGHPELCRRPCMHLDCIAGSLGLGEKNMLSKYTWPMAVMDAGMMECGMATKWLSTNVYVFK